MGDREQIKAIHEKVSKLVELAKISGEPLREYKNKTNQYKDMLDTLDNMKEMTGDEKTKEKLDDQQASVLKTWMKYELDFAARIK